MAIDTEAGETAMLKSDHPQSGLSITIKDIAQRLGLSHSTVSRALNDHPLIKSETKLRVRQAAESLGYVPHLSARIMRGSAPPVFGLCIPEIRNEFYASISHLFALRCREAGARMLLAVTGDDPAIEYEEIRAFIEARVTGIAATPSAEPTAATISLLESLPSVQLVRSVGTIHRPVVSLQEEAGCRSAARHLLALGHKRIAYVGTDGSISSGRDRIRGFSSALQEAGVAPLGGGMELLPPSERSGMEAVGRLLSLSERPTALVIGTSQLTIGALGALRATGVSIPREMSVVSYGDSSWFSLLDPPLTAVALPVDEMVDEALKLLGALQVGAKTDSSLAPQLSTELILRKSTAPPCP